jgi:hypothetical protein
MIIGKAAGKDVIAIARKGLWGRFISPRFFDKNLRLLVKMSNVPKRRFFYIDF